MLVFIFFIISGNFHSLIDSLMLFKKEELKLYESVHTIKKKGMQDQ